MLALVEESKEQGRKWWLMQEIRKEICPEFCFIQIIANCILDFSFVAAQEMLSHRRCCAHPAACGSLQQAVVRALLVPGAGWSPSQAHG